MDPKDINQLDPKLREAYERVMGTNIPAPSTPQAPNEPSVQPPAEPSTPPFTTSTPAPASPPSFDSSQTSPAAQENPPAEAPPAPVHLDTSQAPNPVSPPPVYQSYNAESGSQPPSSEAAVVHHSSRLSISTPILVVLGITFFIAYAALWIMVFGIKLF